MKIEKINDNQIRCTLTKSDLEERHIRLSEFAYGTDKARQLFRDMMMQAYRECGWSNESNIPLMIEAVPDRENSLVLTITKVEDPEELDTRFAKFTPTDVMPDTEADIRVEGADDILDTFRKIMEHQKKAAKTKKNAKAPRPAAKENTAPLMTRAYRFRDLERVISAASALGGFYQGSNILFRTRDGSYVLVVRQSAHTPEDFNRVCNILTEYGSGEKWSSAMEAHLAEHEQVVMRGCALQELAGLKARV